MGTEESVNPSDQLTLIAYFHIILPSTTNWSFAGSVIFWDLFSSVKTSVNWTVRNKSVAPSRDRHYTSTHPSLVSPSTQETFVSNAYEIDCYSNHQQSTNFDYCTLACGTVKWQPMAQLCSSKELTRRLILCSRVRFWPAVESETNVMNYCRMMTNNMNQKCYVMSWMMEVCFINFWWNLDIFST